MLVVSGVAVLLLGLSGVFGYLWWSTDSELTETRDELTAEVAELSNTVSDRDDEITQLGDDLQETRDELADAETLLEGTENMVALLEEQQEIIRDCIILSAEINFIIDEGDTPPNSLLREQEDVCAQAMDALDL